MGYRREETEPGLAVLQLIHDRARQDPGFRLHRSAKLRVFRHDVPCSAESVLMPPDAMSMQERLSIAPAECHDQTLDDGGAFRRMYVAVPGRMKAAAVQGGRDVGKRLEGAAPHLDYCAVEACFRKRLMDGVEHIAVGFEGQTHPLGVAFK